MKYFTYKTTNLINGHYYLGKHQTNAKQVTINGQTFQTMTECRNTLNISRQQMFKLLGEENGLT